MTACAVIRATTSTKETCFFLSLVTLTNLKSLLRMALTVVYLLVWTNALYLYWGTDEELTKCPMHYNKRTNDAGISRAQFGL